MLPHEWVTSTAEQLMLEQRRIEQLSRTGLENLALEHILGDQRRFEELAGRAAVNQLADLSGVDAMRATCAAETLCYTSLPEMSRPHSIETALSGAAGLQDHRARWAELQGALVGSAAWQNFKPWQEINRLSASVGLETDVARHLARFADFDRTLRGAMPESAY